MLSCSEAMRELEKHADIITSIAIEALICRSSPRTQELFQRAGFSDDCQKGNVSIICPANQSMAKVVGSVCTFLPREVAEDKIMKGTLDLSLPSDSVFCVYHDEDESTLVPLLLDITKHPCAICGAPVQIESEKHCHCCEFVSAVACKLPDPRNWQIVNSFQARDLAMIQHDVLSAKLREAYDRQKPCQTLQLGDDLNAGELSANSVCDVGRGVCFKPVERDGSILVRVGYEVLVTSKDEDYGLRNYPCLTLETCTREGLVRGLHALMSVACSLFSSFFDDHDISFDASMARDHSLLYPTCFKRVLMDIDRNLVSKHGHKMGLDEPCARGFFEAFLHDCMFMDRRGTNCFKSCEDSPASQSNKSRDLCRAVVQSLRLFRIESLFAARVPVESIDQSRFSAKMSRAFALFSPSSKKTTFDELWGAYESNFEQRLTIRNWKSMHEQFLLWYKRCVGTCGWRNQLQQKPQTLSPDLFSKSNLSQLAVISNRFSKHLYSTPRSLTVFPCKDTFDHPCMISANLIQSPVAKWASTEYDAEYDELVGKIDELIRIENTLHGELRTKRVRGGKSF